MHATLVAFALSLVLAVPVAWGKKQIDPKDYTEGKMVSVTRDQPAAGTLAMMQGAAPDVKFTYVIDSKDGRYEAREFHNGMQLFKPIEVRSGGTVMFRLNSKGRLMYVPLEHGEKTLEVVKFTPKGNTDEPSDIHPTSGGGSSASQQTNSGLY